MIVCGRSLLHPTLQHVQYYGLQGFIQQSAERLNEIDNEDNLRRSRFAFCLKAGPLRSPLTIYAQPRLPICSRGGPLLF